MQLRLDRILSGQGYGSRKEIKALLSDGGVSVDGKTARNPGIKIDVNKSVVSVHGVPLNYREYVYIMMNKPAGVISASEDPKKQTVIDLLPQNMRRPGLFPAGRLDRDTEGFMLITDDGNFAHNILSPSKHVQKQYFAILDGPLTDDEARQFEKGLAIDGGVRCMPAHVEAQADRTRVTAVIQEGKYHQIKRMFAALGHEVLYLKRVAVGGLFLDESLAPGAARELDGAEVELISPGAAKRPE